MSDRALSKRLVSPHGEDGLPPPKRTKHEADDPRQQSVLMNLILPLEGDPFRVIRTGLMQYLDAKDVLYLCSTSRVFRDRLKPAIFNINAALKPFFENPIEFRTQLGHCNALIYGYLPLYFFQCSFKYNSFRRLDIVVEAGNDFTQLEKYILKVGYKDRGTKILKTFRGNYKCRSYTNSRGDYKDKQICVVATNTIPIRAITFQAVSHTAHIISWNKAFSIFPRLTFLEHESICLGRKYPHHYPKLELTMKRIGLRMRTLPSSKEVDRKLLGDFLYPHFENSGNQLNRRVGDRDTWTISLDTTHVAPPATPDFVLEHVTFSIRLPTKNVPFTWDGFYKKLQYCIEADEVASHSLRYRYTSGPIWTALRPMFKQDTLVQLAKLDHEEQERVKGELGWPPRSLSRVVFAKPETWNYKDDEVPKWFERLLDDPHYMAKFDFST